jgi:hypothetical protein
MYVTKEQKKVEELLVTVMEHLVNQKSEIIPQEKRTRLRYL